MAGEAPARPTDKAGTPASADEAQRLTERDDGRQTRRTGTSPLRCSVDRCFLSGSGFFLILGWMADEGGRATRLTLCTGDTRIDLPAETLLRHARPDLETTIRDGAFDYGFVAFGKLENPVFDTPVVLHLHSEAGTSELEKSPEGIADKRILDAFLIIASKAQSHAGNEVNLSMFLRGTAGTALAELFRKHIDQGTKGHAIRRFRPRPVARTFVTVLFGSVEAIAQQPLLFRQHGIDFGEWIYVINSPEDASSALRLGQIMSDLYDLPITIIVMGDNVGFGAANNLAVSHAASDAIYIINPDVYPLPSQAATLRTTLEERPLGRKLWGGLLFYDDDNLMHSGMYIEQDLFFRRRTMNSPAERMASSFGLLRVEHFDKSVPFEEIRWRQPLVVPAITGALMAFDRRCFDKIGGFSSDYIYGHYEDADLCLRWAQQNGPVVIDPRLRLVHLEGQGARVRGEQYGAAGIINRYVFSHRHAAAARGSQSPRQLTADE